MIETREIKGPVPVLVTPFLANGDIDEEGLIRLVQFLTDLDIGGLWVLGTGSEDMNLSYEKRLQVARIVSAANRGRVPAILGAGFFAMEDIIRFTDDTAELDYDGYHVMPYHPLLGLGQLKWFYEEIAGHCSKPLWLYTSGNWCRYIPPSFFSDLKENPNVAGVKFSSVNCVDQLKVINMIEGNQFQVITAVVTQFYACLAMGSRAHTSSLGSALPEVMIRIYNLFTKGELEAAFEEQMKLNEYLSKYPKRWKECNFLQAAQEKYILKRRGICEPFTSSYYTEVNEDEGKALDRLLDEYGYLQG